MESEQSLNSNCFNGIFCSINAIYRYINYNLTHLTMKEILG